MTQRTMPAVLWIATLASLALFALVYSLRHRFSIPGTLFTVWLVLYSVGQFFLFFGRANSVVLLGLKQAQLTAIVTVLLAVPAYLLWRRYYLERTERRDQEQLPEPAQTASTGTGGASG